MYSSVAPNDRAKHNCARDMTYPSTFRVDRLWLANGESTNYSAADFERIEARLFQISRRNKISFLQRYSLQHIDVSGNYGHIIHRCRLVNGDMMLLKLPIRFNTVICEPKS